MILNAPFLWANLPNEYKLATSLHDFKLKIKNCITINVCVGYANIFNKIYVFCKTSDLINFLEKMIKKRNVSFFCCCYC